MGISHYLPEDLTEVFVGSGSQSPEKRESLVQLGKACGVKPKRNPDHAKVLAWLDSLSSAAIGNAALATRDALSFGATHLAVTDRNGYMELVPVTVKDGCVVLVKDGVDFMGLPTRGFYDILGTPEEIVS